MPKRPKFCDPLMTGLTRFKCIINKFCNLFSQLVNVGEEVLVFYSDPQSFNCLVDMMQSERERLDESGPLLYHINLVELLACCTEGKNVYTEIKCHSLLPLDDIVRVVTHPDCIAEVRGTGVWGDCSTEEGNISHAQCVY